MEKKVVNNNYFSTKRKIRIVCVIFVFISATTIFASAFTSPKQKNDIKKNKNIPEPHNERNESKSIFHRALGIVLFRKNVDNNELEKIKIVEISDINKREEVSVKQLKDRLLKTEERIKRLTKQRYNAENNSSRKIVINLKTHQLNESLQRLYNKKILIAEQLSNSEKNQDLYATKLKSINKSLNKKNSDNLEQRNLNKIDSDISSKSEEVILKNNVDSVKYVTTGTITKEDNSLNKPPVGTINKYGYRVVSIDDLFVDGFANNPEEENVYVKKIQEKLLQNQNNRLSINKHKKHNEVIDNAEHLKAIEQNLVGEKEVTFKLSDDISSVTDSYVINDYGANVWNTTYENRSVSHVPNKTENYIHEMITNGKIDEIKKMSFNNNDVRKVVKEFILVNLKKEHLPLSKKDTINEYISMVGEAGTEEDIEFLRYINSINEYPNDYYIHNISMSLWKLKNRYRDNSLESEDDFNDATDYINYICDYYKLNPNENMKLYNFEIEFLSDLVDSLSKSKYKNEAVSVIEKLTHFKNDDFTNYINKIITSINNELNKENIDKSYTLVK